MVRPFLNYLLHGGTSLKNYWFAGLAAIGLLVGCSGSGDTASGAGEGGGETKPATTVAYADVQSILTENCAGCHGETNPKEGINLTSYANVMKGGHEGTIVKGGDVDGSLLARVLRGKQAKQMPPGGPIAEDKIAKIEDWIKSGAKE